MPSKTATLCGWWASFLLRHIAREDTSQTSLAYQMRVPETTMRNWITEQRSPSADWVAQNRSAVPAAMMGEYLTLLADGRFTISPAAPGSTQPGDLMQQALALGAKANEVSQDVYDMDRDGVRTTDEMLNCRAVSEAAREQLIALIASLDTALSRQKTLV